MQPAVIEWNELTCQSKIYFGDLLLIIFWTTPCFLVFMAKSVVFSIELITDGSKSAGEEAQTSQLSTSIIHVHGRGLRVTVMMTRCALDTQRVGRSSDHGSDRSLTSGEWIR
jgi:hypothetical protein